MNYDESEVWHFLIDVIKSKEYYLTLILPIFFFSVSLCLFFIARTKREILV